jgi:polyhydroxybutyrate depolymerase
MKPKNLFLLLLLLFFFLKLNAQWSNKSFIYQALTRSYRIYVSPNYNAANPASMVLTLHGLGDNMTNFSGLGFNHIADTANIIVVVPQAVSDAFVGTAWNSGAGEFGYYPNSTVNDIGFLNTLIDTVKSHYSIKPSQVYICGFSMGGFMTERMALQSNTQIAAFASMSGTFGSAITTYAPGRSVPIAHFHGTHDSTVYYQGNLYGIDADSLVSFWRLNNGCNPVPDSSRYANTTLGDSITVDRFKYSGSTPDKDVWFFRMNGASHEVLFTPTNDINEIYEIWLFFRLHKNMTAGIQTQTVLDNNVQVYPNPASSFINLMLPENAGKLTVELYSVQGACVYSGETNSSLHQILIGSDKFTNGMYILRASGNSLNVSQKVLIQK